VAHPEGPSAVKVGVVLVRRPDDLGGWLADGAAFEAAGADVLWVDIVPESALDPLALTAALAAVTYRSLLVTAPPGPDWPAQAVARMLATVGQLSHGRLRIRTDAVPVQRPASIGPALGVFRPVPGDPESFEHTPEPGEPGDAERWLSAPAPDSRAAWQATILDAAEGGFHGLLVPADPRLLDILRNPDDPGDRSDLQLAQG
jgi:hypothetical protein